MRNVTVAALKRRSKNGKGSKATHAPTAPNQRTSPPPKGLRLWLFRLAALTLVPLLLFAGTELVLRLLGFGYPTSFFKHAIINGEKCLVENDQFGLRFFPPELARSPAPVVMRAHKPPGTYRIFLLGESAALGDPAPAFGVGRYLQSLLRERFPGTEFEVVCVAMTAINSHAILPIARECAKHDGDLWVLYMGNNEMVGPFGAATVFGAKAPPGWLVRLRLALGHTRLMQAMARLASRWPLRHGENDNRTWEGMKLFRENQLAPDDPSREIAYRNFQENLRDILRAGQRAGVPIVLSTVAVNLKDFAPLGSRAGRAAGTNLPPEFVKLVSDAVKSQAASDWARAIQSYESAARLLPRHADIKFRLGQCQLAMSDHTAALARFSQARDDDSLPFRADSRVNAIIAAAAREHADREVHFLDAQSVMVARSEHGIPGDESFYEHVHFNFDGNYHLARAMAEVISKQLPPRITEKAATDWATQEQCERDLGLTDWNRREVLENVLLRLQQPPFAEQPENSRRLRHWRTRLEQVRRQLTAANAGAARALYLEALRSQPDDFRLHWNFAEFLEATRDLPRAVEEWRKVQSLIPHHHVGCYQLGRLLAELGQREEAHRWLDQAVTLRPDLGAGWFELGRLSFTEGGHEEAMRLFTQAQRLLPQDARIPLQVAKCLSQLGRRDEAIQQARDSVRLDSTFWEARVFLGEQLAVAGRLTEAQTELEAALKLKPEHAQTHLMLGLILMQQSRAAEAIRHFEEALRINPLSQQAKQYLEQLKSR